MRRSRKQPREGGAAAPRGGGSSGPDNTARPANTIGKSLRGMSAQMGLGDLTRWVAERAEAKARREAQAEGRTASQVRGAARRARAESLRQTANRAGVRVDTARRWAKGTQRPAATTEKTARAKVQRAAGGAAEVRASKIASHRQVGVGNQVKVRVTSGGKSWTESRNIGTQSLGATTMERAAELTRQGNDAAAAELIEDAVLDAYGDGLSGFMDILDAPDGVTWS